MPNISETVANIFITISGLFIAHMGMDFTEYLNNYRLIMAAKLLKSSDESILMLAGSVVLTACLILIVFLKENMVKEGAIIIDVGINRVDGKLCGDVDFENVSKLASFITPVPGGVGPMTIAMLLNNTLRAYDKRGE